MKILFLSRWFPFPPNNGSKIRILNLLRILADNHQVSLLSFEDEPEKPAKVEGLETICEQVITIPWKAFEPTSKRSVLGFFNLKPRTLIDTFSDEMAQQIQAIFAEQAFDVIIASQTSIAGSTYIGKRVLMSGQTGVLDHLHIANDVVLVQRAGVISDIKEPGMYAGHPLQPLRQYFKNASLVTKLADMKKQINKLEKLLESGD